MKKKTIYNLLAAILPAAAVLCFILVRILGTPDGSSTLYAQAAEAVEQGDYDQADLYFDQMEDDFPEYLPQYELQAERQIKENNLSGAIAILEKGSENTGSAYLQQMADTLSNRPELSYNAAESGEVSVNEEQAYPQTELIGMNYDFIVRYTNTNMDRQVHLSFENYYSNGPCHWTSSNPLVATVDQHGVVTCGSQPGEAEITVTDELSGSYAHCWVYVVEPEIFKREDTSDSHYASSQSPFAFISEGSFQYLDFYDPAIEEKIEIVRNNSVTENIPLIYVKGSGLADSGIGKWEEESAGSLYERVDENGNPIVKAEDETESTGEVQLDYSWSTFYFSGDFQIPTTLQANNGKTYTVSSVDFGSSSDITHLYIPATIASFDTAVDNPFTYFPSLESIEVEPGNPLYTSVDGVLYSADGTKLIAYPSKKQGATFAIPDGVTEIGRGAFAVSPYSSSALPDESNMLQTISIPASVSVIEPEELTEIKTLKKIELDPGNTHFKMENGFLMDLDSNVIGFSQESVGTDMVITNASDELNFVNNKTIESLTIDADMGSINIETCESLRSLTVNGEANSLYVYECPALEQVIINSPVDDITISHYNKEDLRVTLNATASSISFYAPYIIENLDYVTDNIYGTINDCYNLTISNSLRSLNLTLPTDADIDPSLFSESSLYELSLTGGKLDNLSFIGGMTDLRYFDLSETQVGDWSGLWDATQISLLGIENCEGIHDISGIRNMPNLVSFEFIGMEVDDISPLASCSLLQRICLDGTKGLDNLSALYNLPNLHYITLDQSDASEGDRQAFRDAGARVD